MYIRIQCICFYYYVQEGIEFLEKNSPALAEQCKKVATETAENGSGDATEPIKNGNSPTKLARDNTMVVTAQVLIINFCDCLDYNYLMFYVVF